MTHPFEPQEINVEEPAIHENPADLSKIDYQIYVDIAATWHDAAQRLRIKGHLINRGAQAISFDRSVADSLLIGGRFLDGNGLPLVGLEARAAISGGLLPGGQQAPFSITLPAAGVAAGACSVQISLVRESEFWLCDRGLPSMIFALASQSPTSETSASADESESLDIAKLTVDRQSELEAFHQRRAGLDQRATLDDLWSCFRLFFNRVPDESGFEYFSALVHAGTSVKALTHLFLSSDEFLARLERPEQAEHIQVRVNGIDLFMPMPKTPDEHRIASAGYPKSLFTGPLSGLLEQGDFVVDVGAGIGEFSALASRKVGDQGRVVAFEPDPALTRLLLANVTAHSLENIDVLPFAAADGDGFVALVQRGMLKTCREIMAEDLLGDATIAYARSLDSALPGNQCVNLIRIALDGFDYRAAVGASTLLRRWKPHFFGEYAPGLLHEFSSIAPEQYLKFLLDCGYRRFSVLSAQHGAIDLGNDVGKLAEMPARLGTATVDFCASA